MDSYETHKLVWRKKIEVAYDPRSFAGYAHLQIRSAQAKPLPISETGYRSHFAHPVDIDQLGGPAAYVESWLDVMAETRAWKCAERDGVQLALF